jgi:hypothetical protein
MLLHLEHSQNTSLNKIIRGRPHSHRLLIEHVKLKRERRTEIKQTAKAEVTILEIFFFNTPPSTQIYAAMLLELDGHKEESASV